MNCSMVVPVVYDVLQDIGVASLRNGRKEVAADDLATIGDASVLE